jgi:hypothetical protein
LSDVNELTAIQPPQGEEGEYASHDQAKLSFGSERSLHCCFCLLPASLVASMLGTLNSIGQIQMSEMLQLVDLNQQPTG